jgi:hypothetical protein
MTLVMTDKATWEYVEGSAKHNGRGYHTSWWILRGPQTWREAQDEADKRRKMPVEDYYVMTARRPDGGWDVRYSCDSGD